MCENWQKLYLYIENIYYRRPTLPPKRQKKTAVMDKDVIFLNKFRKERKW